MNTDNLMDLIFEKVTQAEYDMDSPANHQLEDFQKELLGLPGMDQEVSRDEKTLALWEILINEVKDLVYEAEREAFDKGFWSGVKFMDEYL